MFIRATSFLALIAFTFYCATASCMCFAVYDAKDSLVLQTTETPIDLSKSISGQMEKKFPGHYLTMSNVGYCPFIEKKPERVASTSISGDTRRPSAAEIASFLAQTPSFGDGGDGDIPGVSSGLNGGGTGRHQPGRDVNVRAYTRSNGTAVSAHTRASPGRGR
jgi:hypothetical protein